VINLTLNGKSRALDVDPEMPLLWAIRDVIGLTGTKYGCGIAQCGACTVHVDDAPVRSCQTAIGDVANRSVVTIEGLSNKVGQTVQKVWTEFDVPQCGYCQSGQIMSATALLSQNPKPTDNDIDSAMAGNLCRCATYHRIRAAIHEVANRMGRK
jgi:isoquinoline 1-oxidoreductase subunit alpha